MKTNHSFSSIWLDLNNNTSCISVGCKDAGGADQSRASSSPLSSFLQGKAPACWEHTWAVHGSAEIPTAPTPPPTSHPSCSVLALWRVNWADLWDRRGGHRTAAFPPEPRTSTLRLEEICSTILRPPAFQGWARTEGRGRDLGGGQAFSSGSSFTPHVPSSTPHWSF